MRYACDDEHTKYEKLTEDVIRLAQYLDRLFPGLDKIMTTYRMLELPPWYHLLNDMICALRDAKDADKKRIEQVNSN